MPTGQQETFEQMIIRTANNAFRHPNRQGTTVATNHPDDFCTNDYSDLWHGVIELTGYPDMHVTQKLLAPTQGESASR